MTHKRHELRHILAGLTGGFLGLAFLTYASVPWWGAFLLGSASYFGPWFLSRRFCGKVGRLDE